MLKRITSFLRYRILTPEQYARYVGVNLGKECLIATRLWSTEPFLITIGNNVQITSDVRFHTHGGGHVLRGKYPDFDTYGKIQVEDNVYIGAASHIMGGVVVGKGSLIAAGSVVTKSVPPGMVVGGNPAKIICTVEEFEAKNLKYNLKTKGLSRDSRYKVLKEAGEMFFIKKEYLKYER